MREHTDEQPIINVMPFIYILGEKCYRSESYYTAESCLYYRKSPPDDIVSKASMTKKSSISLARQPLANP
jgi:hypothetical protein